MRIPESEDPWNMDSKLKFADRLKALLNNESRQDVDPYVFSEPEPFTSSSGATSAVAAAVAAKNFKFLASKNSKNPHFHHQQHHQQQQQQLLQQQQLQQQQLQQQQHLYQQQQSPNNRPTKSKSKCNNQRIKIKQELTSEVPSRNFRFNDGIQHGIQQGVHQRKRKQQNSVRPTTNAKRPSRDHTLLYYPRAGDEISDSDSSGEEASIYQRHWFAGESTVPMTRSSRLIQLRSQLRRRLIQLHKSGVESETNLRGRTRCLVKAAHRDPSSAARSLGTIKGSRKVIDGPLLVGSPCLMNNCRQISLPCTRHCARHIMMNVDQQLFEHCTAKFSDNTQCSIPVFDVAHELPLCPEHARKRDNYHRKAQESKPKKSRKKPTSLATMQPSSGGSTNSTSSSSVHQTQQTTMPRPKAKSRPKKRKRPQPPSAATTQNLPPPTSSTSSTSSPLSANSSPNCKQLMETKSNVVESMVIAQQADELTDVEQEHVHHHHHHDHDHHHHHHRFVSHIPVEGSHTKTLNNLNAPQGTSNTNLNNLGLGLGGLGLGGGLKVELGDHEVFASLDAAEHDFGNVLNNLPADAFNDLFIESRNGEYEPSREEEEELERALEAVDKDVRTLERLGQSHGLLEPALLAQLMSDIAS